jgi:hypothetical protein
MILTTTVSLYFSTLRQTPNAKRQNVAAQEEVKKKTKTNKE